MTIVNIGKFTLLCGTSLMACTTAAYAQDTAPIDQNVLEGEASAISQNDVIIVTGTQIKGAKINDVLPVTVMDEEAIETINPGSGDELFRAIPQAGSVAFNEQNTTGGVNGARGDIASINLRDLGTGNTLMLINGRRMVLDPGFQTELLVPVVSPDTNTIVPGGVRRVEVLRDGASAVYGADAVAGVVNTVMKNNMNGGFVQGSYRNSDGTDLYNTSIRGGYGFDFNEGRSNLTLFANYFHENGAPASIRSYSASSDRRFDERILGTPWEGDTNFRNLSTLTPWGQFDIQGSGARGSTDINDDDFQIQPDSFAGCRLDLGNGICADNGTSVDTALRYDLDNDRTLYSEKDRYNFDLLFNHELSDAVEFHMEGSFYRSKSSRLRESSGNLTAVPIGITRDAYWNPLGAELLQDGSINPNRLTDGIDGVNSSGRDLLMERYRVIDGGPRRGTVSKNVYRFVAGLTGELGSWDFDTAFVYSQANKNDLTRGRISSTAFQDAINRNDESAYNPFNGGCYDETIAIGPAAGDCTPNPESTLAGIRIDVSRKGETTLALVDFKVSRPDLMTLPGGDVGIATGVEIRRETFKDDRDENLDGTFTFTNAVNGNFFGSNVLGSSPSPDTSGSREVYSGFAELFVPLVGDDMNIPLVQNFNVQLAARFESFSDINETAFVPRVAASWTLFDGLLLRGAWSRGFRAPNLVQVNDLGTSRVNTRDDYVQCFAQIQKDEIDDFDDCSGTGTVSLRTGTNNLKPEKTTSINLGIVLTPGFMPGLTLTADYWRVKQNGIVGVFGDDNALALDLLRRLDGGSNANVTRDAPDQDQIDLFAGTGLDPVGNVSQVLDPYLNLDSRTTKGWDFGLFYDIGDFGIGNFDIAINAAHLKSFFQSPGADGQELLDAVADGTLPDSIVISDIGELREQNGRPKWRWTAALNWKSGPVRMSLFGRHVGGVYDDSVTQDSFDEQGDPNPDVGSFFPVDDWFVMNATVSYSFNKGPLDGTRIRLGINNLANKKPPLADQSYGYFSNLHSARGRQFTVQLRHKF